MFEIFWPLYWFWALEFLYVWSNLHLFWTLFVSSDASIYSMLLRTDAMSKLIWRYYKRHILCLNVLPCLYTDTTLVHAYVLIHLFQIITVHTISYIYSLEHEFAGLHRTDATLDFCRFLMLCFLWRWYDSNYYMCIYLSSIVKHVSVQEVPVRTFECETFDLYSFDMIQFVSIWAWFYDSLMNNYCIYFWIQSF